MRNYVNCEVRKAKRNYYHRSFDKAKTDMKKSWNLIRKLLGTKPKSSDVKKLIVDGSEIVHPADIANCFNDFFSSVANDLEARLPPINHSHSSYLNVPNPHSFYLFDMNSSECYKIISGMKNTSSGPDSMPVKIFKSIASSIINPICKLVNLSFRVGLFPSSLKTARITPVYKKGNREELTNYRPIASLPFMSKIFERCMANKLVSFLKKFSILHPSQFGFQKFKSTCDALIHLTNFNYNSLNENKIAVNVLIDLRKAFDTVAHHVLLDKLFSYGIRGTPLNWFRTYLRNRRQYVRVGSFDSSEKIINIGVPQGSTLGPILFLLFINDLPNASSLLFPTLFADDTTLSIARNEFSDLISVLNQELQSVKEWTVSSRLSINVDKTEMVLISNKNVMNINGQVLFDNEFLNFSNSCVFLGTRLDHKLSFADHTGYVLDKLSKNTGILYRIKDDMTPQARLNYYYALLYPYLSYNIVVWGSTFQCHLNPVVLIQKRIMRLIAGADFLAHTSPLFKEFKVLKFNDIFTYSVSVYMFKAIRDGYYSPQHNLPTRHGHEISSSFNRLTTTQHRISFTGPKIWIKLPLFLREINSLPLFKQKLKTYLIDQYDCQSA